jgi:RNA polymerase sigma factor for flagellar operon FliA
MHRAVNSYASKDANDEATVALQKYGGIIDRLARRLVSRTGMQSAYDDLWSAGALGLIEAMRRFDSTKGAAFETFAEHRVRGAMLDELRRQDHLPRRLRNRTDEMQKAKSKLSSKLGREATVEEVAEEMDADLDEVSGVHALLEPHVPLESVVAQLVSEDSTDDPFVRKQLVLRMTRAIEKIPDRLQMVLQLHYVEGLTYKEISGMLDVSEPRVCQLHADAITKVRAAMGSEG